MEHAASEAIFGSSSRRDGDELSDRDILIVDSDTRVLSRRQKVLEEDGWSVASYTFNKLRALSERGALFVQHLKTEGEVTWDADGRLLSILQGFRPKTSYVCEIAENARLAELMARWPASARGALWAADVLYVTTRNFGILFLAQRGNYVFSYSKLLHELSHVGAIRDDGVGDLLELRRAKALYRAGQQVEQEWVATRIVRALAALPSSQFPRATEGICPKLLLSQTAKLSSDAPSYHCLRNLERSYLALLEVPEHHNIARDFSVLARWIEDPRAYAGYARSVEAEIIEQMQRIGRRVAQLTHAA
jgi:hypothetical protein